MWSGVEVFSAGVNSVCKCVQACQVEWCGGLFRWSESVCKCVQACQVWSCVEVFSAGVNLCVNVCRLVKWSGVEVFSAGVNSVCKCVQACQVEWCGGPVATEGLKTFYDAVKVNDELVCNLSSSHHCCKHN